MRIKISCTNPACTQFNLTSGNPTWIKPHGTYTRGCDRRVIKRFRCTNCGRTFSRQSFNPTYRQRRPDINKLVRILICSKVSLRQIAREFSINQKTVHKRMLWLAEQGRKRQQQRLSGLKDVNFIQIDEMETHEHSKCKPLSIALAVIPGSRLILGANASEMPAKGHLAEISRKKYGIRRDDRKPAFQDLLRTIKPRLSPDVWVFSDKKSTYPTWIREILPAAVHFKVKGRRGCIAGYGEMKKIGFDPLFWLNHTAATVRDALARMLRKTWCNTKKLFFLQQTLDIHIDYHNEKMERLGKQIFDRQTWLNRCIRANALTNLQ
jgi:transposase-like protein